MKYVLFVCTHNAGRSQIAQAFFERYAPRRRARRVGRAGAGGGVWPEVVEAMNEIGIDLAGRRPKKIDLEMQLHADWAITLACGGTCPYVPGIVEDWEIPDPPGRPLDEVRAIRDELEQKRARAARDAARRDPHRPHARTRCRLAQLLPSLVKEFGDESRRGDPRLRGRCARRYDDAPVRSFLLTLARRNAQDCLREGRCAALV